MNKYSKWYILCCIDIYIDAYLLAYIFWRNPKVVYQFAQLMEKALQSLLLIVVKVGASRQFECNFQLITINDMTRHLIIIKLN